MAANITANKVTRVTFSRFISGLLSKMPFIFRLVPGQAGLFFILPAPVFAGIAVPGLGFLFIGWPGGRTFFEGTPDASFAYDG